MHRPTDKLWSQTKKLGQSDLVYWLYRSSCFNIAVPPVVLHSPLTACFYVSLVKEGFWASGGSTSPRMLRSTPDRVCRVSSRLFAGAVTHCSVTFRVCQIMYRPKQFCVWHATSETEYHPSQTGADHGAVLLSPGCTRFVQTVVCPLEMLSTAPRIGPCGERTLRPPRPRVDDD